MNSKNEKIWTYESLKGVEGIDYDILVNVMNADWLEDVKVPSKLGECIRIKDKADNAGKMSTEGAKFAPTGYAKDTEKTNHAIDIYGLQMGNGEIETFEDMKSRDDRYAELVNQNQEAGYTVNTVEKLTPAEVEDAYKKRLEK